MTRDHLTGDARLPDGRERRRRLHRQEEEDDPSVRRRGRKVSDGAFSLFQLCGIFSGLVEISGFFFLSFS